MAEMYVKPYLKKEHTGAPRIAGNTFQDLPRLHETADNTKRYI